MPRTQRVTDTSAKAPKDAGGVFLSCQIAVTAEFAKRGRDAIRPRRHLWLAGVVRSGWRSKCAEASRRFDRSLFIFHSSYGSLKLVQMVASAGFHADGFFE
jgi:hypothetical protein